MKRRRAITNSLLGLTGMSLSNSYNYINKMLMQASKQSQVGIQLFTIPHMVDQDFEGTLELLSNIGYTEIELFGPYPFSAERTKQGWAQMQQMLNLKQHAFYGLTIDETVQILSDHKLKVPSVHSNISTMRDGLEVFLDGISATQCQYIVVPALLEPSDRNSRDQYSRLANEFNEYGAKMSAYDMKFVYHNHGYEHIIYEGQMGLDILLSETDPELVQFELDVFWMKAAGQDPIAYLNKYPGRFKLMHLKDSATEFRFSRDGSTPDQWMAGFPQMSDPGEGVYNIEEMIKTGLASGVDHFFLERDLAPEPQQTLQNSFNYLSKHL